jgi:rhodanese-related sulfurtransferase
VKNIGNILLGLLFLSCLSNCSTSKTNSANADVKDTISISVKQAFKIITENKDNSNFVILDVRKPEDFQKEHIAKAMNIDFKSDSFSIKLDNLDKNKTYLINCYGGFRSKNTMKMMKEKGFVKLYNMKGGFIKWKLKKLPTISDK